MLKSYFSSSKEKTLDAISLSKRNIVHTVTVACVTDDGAIDVGEMTAELVTTTGFRPEFDEGVSCGRVMVDGNGKFCFRESSEYRSGILRSLALDTGIIVFKLTKWMFDHSTLRSKATHDGLVGFAHSFFLKGNG